MNDEKKGAVHSEYQHRLTEAMDAEVAEYKSISALAVAGLILGLLSPLALVDELLWAVPIAGILVCGLALRRIGRTASAMLGRKAALTGLWLAVLSLAAATSDWGYYRWRIRAEAEKTGLSWFDLLAKNQAETAFRLTLPPQQRRPLDQPVGDFYKKSATLRTALENFVDPGKPEGPRRLVRTLLALGEQAQVRYLKTLDQTYVESQDVVDQLYAVTFNDSGEKKTFFVNMRLTRIITGSNRVIWQIVSIQSEVDQEGKPPPQQD